MYISLASWYALLTSRNEPRNLVFSSHNSRKTAENVWQLGEHVSELMTHRATLFRYRKTRCSDMGSSGEEEGVCLDQDLGPRAFSSGFAMRLLSFRWRVGRCAPLAGLPQAKVNRKSRARVNQPPVEPVPLRNGRGATAEHLSLILHPRKRLVWLTRFGLHTIQARINRSRLSDQRNKLRKLLRSSFFPEAATAFLPNSAVRTMASKAFSTP